MTTRKLVDVMVLGSRIAPLSAACILARRGYRVLHVEHENLSGHYTDRGFRLPMEPDIVPGPRSSPAIANVLQILAINTDAQRLLRPVSPDLQILAPGHRFNFPSEPAKRRKELAREFGTGESEKIESLLNSLIGSDKAIDPLLTLMPQLPSEGFFEKRALAKSTANLPLDAPPPEFPDHLITRALAGLSRFSSYLFETGSGNLHSIRSGARFLRSGMHRFEDAEKTGQRGYNSLLKKRLGELGGTSISASKAAVEEIIIEGSNVSGLKLVDDISEYRCRHLVSGLNVYALRELLPDDKRLKKLDLAIEKAIPEAFMFTVNIVLSRRALPTGLGETAIYIPDTSSEIFFLQVFDATGEEGHIPEMAVLQASCFIDCPESPEDSLLEEKTAYIISTLKKDLLPFMDRYLHLVSSPMQGKTGLKRNKQHTLHTVYRQDPESTFGVSLLSPRTPYKNLILSCREIIPGLGVEGEFLAGFQAAEIVSKSTKKHDPLKSQ